MLPNIHVLLQMCSFLNYTNEEGVWVMIPITSGSHGHTLSGLKWPGKLKIFKITEETYEFISRTNITYKDMQL